MQAGPVTSFAPSFNCYSNGKLAEIAARVVEEFDSGEFCDEFYFGRRENSAAQRVEGGRISDNRVPEVDAVEDREEFEFAFVTRDVSELSSPISADVIFHNGKIRPVYPVFNRDLLLGHIKFQNENEKENDVRNFVSSNRPKIRRPLRKLFIEERETTMTMSMSSSSSASWEAGELDGVPAETYCLWQPSAAAEEEGQCGNSNSTGCISKRWSLKDLLHRSHSYGSRDSLGFSNPKQQQEEKVKKRKES